MPGVDFDRLRQEVTMEQVLTLLHFEPSGGSGDQWRGPCPVHQSTLPSSRSFSVNLCIGRYYCHKCRSQGNPIDLWSAIKQLSIYDAAVDLCHALGRDVPYIRRC